MRHSNSSSSNPICHLPFLSRPATYGTVTSNTTGPRHGWPLDGLGFFVHTIALVSLSVRTRVSCLVFVIPSPFHTPLILFPCFLLLIPRVFDDSWAYWCGGVGGYVRRWSGRRINININIQLTINGTYHINVVNVDIDVNSWSKRCRS